MREYLITLIGVVAVCGIVQMLAPEGEGGGMKKYIALVSGLCVLCVCIAPLYDLFVWISSDNGEGISSLVGEYVSQEDYLVIYEEEIMSRGGENMSAGLKSLIARDLLLDFGSFDVSVALESAEDEYIVRDVYVTIHGSASQIDPHKIEEYVGALLGCECVIIYD